MAIAVPRHCSAETAVGVMDRADQNPVGEVSGLQRDDEVGGDRVDRIGVVGTGIAKDAAGTRTAEIGVGNVVERRDAEMIYTMGHYGRLTRPSQDLHPGFSCPLLMRDQSWVGKDGHQRGL